MTDADLAFIRSWLTWSTLTDQELVDLGTSLGGGNWRVIEQQVRIKYLTMLATPASFTVPGDWSQNTGPNMDGMLQLWKLAQRELATEDAELAGESTVARLVRTDPNRTDWPGELWTAAPLDP